MEMCEWRQSSTRSSSRHRMEVSDLFYNKAALKPERPVRTHFIDGWVGPKIVLNSVEKRNLLVFGLRCFRLLRPAVG
jgi:hypothetical protein